MRVMYCITWQTHTGGTLKCACAINAGNLTSGLGAPNLQVQNGVQFGVICTTLYYVFVWRTHDAAGKTVFFSKKIPLNLDLVWKDQQITLKVILAAELYLAATKGRYVRVDTWARTPINEEWTKR